MWVRRKDDEGKREDEKDVHKLEVFVCLIKSQVHLWLIGLK